MALVIVLNPSTMTISGCRNNGLESLMRAVEPAYWIYTRFVSYKGNICTILIFYHELVARLPSWFPGAWFVNFIKGSSRSDGCSLEALTISSETKPAMDAIGGGNYYKVEQEMVTTNYSFSHLFSRLSPLRNAAP